jgi:hypothetical protein
MREDDRYERMQPWWRLRCQLCGDPFVAARLHAQFCSPACRKAASRSGRLFNRTPFLEAVWLGWLHKKPSLLSTMPKRD